MDDQANLEDALARGNTAEALHSTQYRMSEALARPGSHRASAGSSAHRRSDLGDPQEPLVFTNNGPAFADDTHGFAHGFETDLTLSSNHRSVNSSGGVPILSKPAEPHVQVAKPWVSRSSYEVPSVNEQAYQRQLSEKKDAVGSWLLNESTDLEVAPEEMPAELIRKAEHKRDFDDGIHLGHETINQQKPGRIYLTGNKDQLSKEDFDIPGANRNWAGNPMHPSIRDIDQRLRHASSRHAIEAFERMCRETNDGSPQRFDRFRLFDLMGDPPPYESAPVSKKYQPESSQAAIEQYNRMSRDPGSVVSKAATWGTRRLSLGSEPDLATETGVVGNLLKLAEEPNRGATRPRRIRYFDHGSTAIGDQKNTQELDNQEMQDKEYKTGHKVDRGTRVPVRKEISELSLDTDVEYTKPATYATSTISALRGPRSRSDGLNPWVGGPSSLVETWNESGGPPVAKLAEPSTTTTVEQFDSTDDDDDDQYEQETSREEFDLIDNITPDLAGFRQHVLALYPSLVATNTYLLNRIAHQQEIRYKRLLRGKTNHLHMGAICPSGALCIALGGSAILLKQDYNKPMVNDLYFSEEDEVSDGVTLPHHFPPGIPMPPTPSLPAELECQVCYQTKKFTRFSDWTKHIHEDVMPFTCTWENCIESKSFKCEADWVQHENERHRHLQWWTCDVDECRHVCYHRDNFLQHLVQEHKFLKPRLKTKYFLGRRLASNRSRYASDPTQKKALACLQNTTVRPQDEPCRFCGEVVSTWRKLTVHVAKHMKKISFPILRLVDKDGAEINAGYVVSPLHYSFEYGGPVPWPRPEWSGYLTQPENRRPIGTVFSCTAYGTVSPAGNLTLPSIDSGYASMKKTEAKRQIYVGPYAPEDNQDVAMLQFDDAATVYTTASSIATWKRESYISDFSNDLFCKINDLQPDENEVEMISTLLPDLLKAFALKLGYQAPTPMYLDVMYIIHKYRSMIANDFKDRGLQEDVHSAKSSTVGHKRMPLRDLIGSQPDNHYIEDSVANEEKLPLSDLVGSWFEGQDPEDVQLQKSTAGLHTGAKDLELAHEGTDDFDSRSRDSAKLEPDLEDNRASIAQYRDLVLETEAFKWLLARLRTEMRLVSTQSKAMETIRQNILARVRSSRTFSRKVPSEEFAAIFEFDWDLARFLEQQKYTCKPSEALPKVITLTGSYQDAQALICVEYLTQTWPFSGAQILQLIQDVLDKERGTMHFCQLSDGTELSAWMQSRYFRVKARGNPFSLAEIAEQIAWLTAALRPSHRVDLPVCFIPFIVNAYTTQSQFLPNILSSTAITHIFKFAVGFDVMQQPPNRTNGQCWHDMFLNPTVVKGYPIPSRVVTKTGLEIPLNMMAGLARSEQVDRFGGLTFIKGFSTLMVPVKRSGNILLWHLLYKRSGSRISYLDCNMPHVGFVSDVDLGSLRHILGWCTEADFYAGSAKANHIVGGSGLTKPQESGALAGLFLSPGRGIMGGSAFLLGLKDTPAHVARNGYIPKLQWIATKFVLLWDEGDKRGWLINGTSALLYIVRASLSHNSTDKFKAAFIFNPEDMKESQTPFTAEAAIAVLINSDNLALKLYHEKEGYLLLRSRVDHYYNILEKLIDHQADIAGEGGSKLADQPRQCLEGWDFRDLATSRDPLYPRMATLAVGGKGWVDLTRALHAVTIFGRGFGELIKPASAETCDFWAEMPKQKYYVAAGLSDLIQVTNNHDYYTDGHARLSESTIWHTPTALFGSCRCRGVLRRDHCEPVQTILPSTMLNSLLPRKIPVPQESLGAVIFGQHSDFPWIWPDHGPPGEKDFSLSSKTSDLGSAVDSRIGSSMFVSKSGSSSELSRSSTPRLNRIPIIYDAGAVSSDATSSAHGTYAQEDYAVGILCALPKELLAVRAIFDKKHGSIDHVVGDINHYSLGQISNHMVVAACLPKGDYGTNPAADAASNMRRSFPNIKFCLLVGIGGGVPSKQHDIRLGDVVVSAPTANYPGVIQYDRGKDTENSNFERTGSLPPPPWFLMTAISRLEGNPDRLSDPLEPYLAHIQKHIRFPERLKYKHPGQEHDIFSQSECLTCQGEGQCDERNGFLRNRSRRPTDDPQISYGLIASGNRVIKDAHVRNEWADKCGVLCFEMEAAGIMNTFPCLVIRGICDYADSSKNKVWQEYAAATAAAYAKLLLEESEGHGSSFGKRSRSLTYSAQEEIPKKFRRI